MNRERVSLSESKAAVSSVWPKIFPFKKKAVRAAAFALPWLNCRLQRFNSCSNPSFERAGASAAALSRRRLITPSIKPAAIISRNSGTKRMTPSATAAPALTRTRTSCGFIGRRAIDQNPAAVRLHRNEGRLSQRRAIFIEQFDRHLHRRLAVCRYLVAICVDHHFPHGGVRRIIRLANLTLQYRRIRRIWIQQRPAYP